MGKDPSRRSRDLTPRERRDQLRRFSPTDAAFVAHLSQCERCRGHAARLLRGGEAASQSGVSGLTPVERDIMFHLTRGSYLLALGDDRPEADLPLAELQKFLDSLSSEQAGFVSHLLHCERCLQAASRLLQPHSSPHKPRRS
jgi:hypothetical protein